MTLLVNKRQMVPVDTEGSPRSQRTEAWLILGRVAAPPTLAPRTGVRARCILAPGLTSEVVAPGECHLPVALTFAGPGFLLFVTTVSLQVISNVLNGLFNLFGLSTALCWR